MWGVPRAFKPLEGAEGPEGTALALVAMGSRVEEEKPYQQALALVEQPELAAAVLESESQRPSPGDQRELVPARNSRMEELLMRMMEENRTLRVRLEQMETQSSWHSGNTSDTSHAAGEHSPISCAQGPPKWLDVQRAALADQEGFLTADTGP